MDVAVPEIGREVGQPTLRVDPLSVPLEHPVDNERVAKVVDAWPATTRLWLEASGADDAAQELFRSDVRLAARLMAEQPSIGLLREPGPCSQFEVVAEGGRCRRLDRQSAGLEELGPADLERVLPGPEIAQC